MPTQLRWLASKSASCFHAAEALARGRETADAAVRDALLQPARAVAGELSAASVPHEFWAHLIPLSAGIERKRELAELALIKTVGRGARQQTLAPRLAGLLTELETAFSDAVPSVLDQLELRSAPLREQWEARGPGMLAQIVRLTAAGLMVEQADAVLVHPMLGGAGAAHLPYNSVRLEAVLVNPSPELPEIVRLAWLIAQLNCDLPLHQGELSRDRAAQVAALALTPIALVAGEEVELCRSHPDAVRQALEAWELAPQKPVETAEVLLDWWRVYDHSRPGWGIALAALDRMLAEQEGRGQ